jgi:peptide chain release factor 2
MAKIIRRSEWQREQELRKIKGQAAEVSFGGQRRSYVLYPYKLIKDHKTEAQTSDVDSVLDGNLDLFIQAAMGL